MSPINILNIFFLSMRPTDLLADTKLPKDETRNILTFFE